MRHGDAVADLVQRPGHGRIGPLSELDPRLGVHQQHVGVPHLDDVEARVLAVDLVRGIEVLARQVPGEGVVEVPQVERFRRDATIPGGAIDTATGVRVEDRAVEVLSPREQYGGVEPRVPVGVHPERHDRLRVGRVGPGDDGVDPNHRRQGVVQRRVLGEHAVRHVELVHQRSGRRQGHLLAALRAWREVVPGRPAVLAGVDLVVEDHFRAPLTGVGEEGAEVRVQPVDSEIHHCLCGVARNAEEAVRLGRIAGAVLLVARLVQRRPGLIGERRSLSRPAPVGSWPADRQQRGRGSEVRHDPIEDLGARCPRDLPGVRRGRHRREQRHAAEQPQQLVVVIAAQEQGLALYLGCGLGRQDAGLHHLELRQDLVRLGDAPVHPRPESPGRSGQPVLHAARDVAQVRPVLLRIGDVRRIVEVDRDRTNHVAVYRIDGVPEVLLRLPEGLVANAIRRDGVQEVVVASGRAQGEAEQQSEGWESRHGWRPQKLMLVPKLITLVCG